MSLLMRSIRADGDGTMKHEHKATVAPAKTFSYCLSCRAVTGDRIVGRKTWWTSYKCEICGGQK